MNQQMRADENEIRGRIRQDNAAMRQAERDRVNSLNQPENEHQRGPSGEAFRARPYALSRSAAVSRGSVSPGQASELLRMTDTCLADRLWSCSQVNDRQHRALKVLLTIWTDAGLNPRVVAPCLYVHDVVWEVEEHLDLSTAGPKPLRDDETWRDRYRALMRDLGQLRACVLEGVLLDQHPGTWRLATAQAGADMLADWWGF